jgi:hypothetical protein
MKDVEKLIGGYATGTLTDEERQALFAEALGNQTLFDALADEEALRELLADPVARRQLLAQLESGQGQKRAGWLGRAWAWWGRPLPMGLGAAAAAAILAIVLIPRMHQEEKTQLALHRPMQQPAPPSVASTPIPEADRPPVEAPRGEPKRATRAPSAGNRAAVPRLERPQASGRAETAAPVKQEEREIAAATAAPAEAAARPPVPQPGATPPAAPPAAVRADLAAEARLAKTAARPSVPFEYAFERQNAAGSWIRIGPAAQFVEGEQVRVVLQTHNSGSITVTLRMPDGTARTLYQGAAVAGGTVQVPTTGGLPAVTGEHRLQIAFGRVGVVGGISGVQGLRMPAEERKRQAAEVARDEAGAVPQPYTVEIPLRFR